MDKIKFITVIVNGLKVYTDLTEWTYEDIVKAASLDPNYVYSCTYSVKLGKDYHRSGILYPKQKIKLDDGMVINICDTSNA